MCNKGYGHLAVEHVILVVRGAEGVQIFLQLQQLLLHLLQTLLQVLRRDYTQKHTLCVYQDAATQGMTSVAQLAREKKTGVI